MSGTFSAQEIAEFNAEFAEFEAAFGEEMAVFDMGGDPDLLDELDALIAETDLGDGVSMASVETMSDEQFEEMFVGGWLKKLARKLIKSLLKFRRYFSRCKTCVAKVAEAIRLYKAKKWISAIRATYAALKCIRKCVS